MPSTQTFENLRSELRRGCLVVAVLAELQSEQYGYTLRKALAKRGIEMDEGTLYPLLRRLESQGLLVSVWREDAKRNKRFYSLSADGRSVFGQLLKEWRELGIVLEGITNEHEQKNGPNRAVSDGSRILANER